MSDEVERYNRLVRSPDAEDENVIILPSALKTYAEQLGQDRRRPKTAIARMVSRLWHRTQMELAMDEGEDVLPLNIDDKENLVRPAYYPLDFGIGFVPHPNEIGATTSNDNRLVGIVAYTSLSVPRPYDPHFHGPSFGAPGVVTPQVGFGFNYLADNPWPGKFDIVQRMGGGPRGGFAFTTGPTEGNYPTGVMPQTTFNLGQLGYTNGGFYPEGITYTNRPRQLRLSGLRNGWAHRVYFARSRKVMFRNIYGNLGTDEATPRTPNVVVNGATPVKGVKSISLTRNLNSPAKCEITISSRGGERTGYFKQFDTIQVHMAPQSWANAPLVFTGFVDSIIDDEGQIKLTCFDTLKYLDYETLNEEPAYPDEDAASTIRAIIGASAYAIPVYNILTSSRIRLPSSLKLKNKTRLAAIQLIMQTINASARQMRLQCNEKGIVQLEVLEDTEDSVAPVIGGQWPRTDKPDDLNITAIKQSSGQSAQFNVAKVINEDGSISVTHPLETSSFYPAKPIVKTFTEKAVVNKQDAELLARQYLRAQNDNERVWTVTSLPNRFDIQPGDVGSFESSTAGLSGKYRIFDVIYQQSSGNIMCTLQIGKPRRNLLDVLKYTLEN